MANPRSLKVLTGAHVDKVLDALSLPLAVSSQAAVFSAFSSGNKHDEAPGVPPLQLPLRHVLTTPAYSMLFMPARVTGATSIKIVSVPKAGSEGLPGTTIIMDEVTGKVRAVVNARRLTALRNAAGSVLSMQALSGADAQPKQLVIFGSGAQAEAHARAFLTAYPSLEGCTIVARSRTPRSEALVAELAKAFPKAKVSLGVASFADKSSGDGFDLSACVQNADIICTMTSSTAPLFASADVKPGAHCCLIGSYKPHMREIEDALVKRAGTILVDSREACAAEAGELQNVDESQMVEIGEVLNSQEMARRVKDAGDVCIFKSVGLGVQDVAISAVVLQEADRLGLGTVIEDYD